MKRPFDIPALSIINGSHSKFLTMQVVAHVLEGFKASFKDRVLSPRQIQRTAVTLDGCQIVVLKRGTTEA